MMTPSPPVLRAPRQAEVHDLDLAVPLDLHVGGLEVPVHDALRVGEGQPLAELVHHVQRALQREGRAARDEVLEVLALEQLHGDVDLPCSSPKS